MPVFRQRATVTEDRYGELVTEFIIADSYALLFSQTGIQDTDIFVIGATKRDLDQETGVQSMDSMDFQMSAARIRTVADADAFALALTADAGNLYCAKFINPSAPGSLDDLEFVGLVDRKMSGTDLLWKGDEWSGAIAPDREWKFNAKSFAAAVLNDLNLLDKKGEDDELLHGILNLLDADTAWKAANIEDKRSFIARQPKEDYSFFVNWRMYQRSLVQLGALLAKLAALASAEISSRIGGSFTISFATSDSDLTCYATRFSIDDGTSGSVWQNRIITGIDYLNMDSERRDVTGTSDDTALWVHSAVIAVKSEEQEMSWGRFETFTKMVYAIAYSVGKFVQFEYVTETDIVIHLVPRRNIIASSEIFLRDASGASIDTSYAIADKVDPYASKCCPQAIEGSEEVKANDLGILITNDNVSKQKGSSLALSIGSPIQQVIIKHQDDASSGPYKTESKAHVMLNQYRFYDYELSFRFKMLEKERMPKTPSSLLYMPFSDKDWSFTSAFDTEFAHTFRPVGAISVRIGSADHQFKSLAEYVNTLNSSDAGYYDSEYSVEVPYVSAFSNASSGSMPSWKRLALGSKLTLDARQYVVVGIERDTIAVKTTIRLQRISRFAFTDTSAGITLPLPVLGSGDIAEPNGEDVFGTIASGDVAAGDFVQITSTGHAIKARNLTARYNTAWGVALTSASDGDSITVRTRGEVRNDDWSWTPGMSIYVRASTGSNLSHDLLDAPIVGTEETVLRVAMATTASTLVITEREEFIL